MQERLQSKPSSEPPYAFAALASLSLLVSSCAPSRYAATPARMDPATQEAFEQIGVDVQISRVQGSFVRRFPAWPTDGAQLLFKKPGDYSVAIVTEKSDAAYLPYTAKVYSNSLQVVEGQEFLLQITGADWPHMNSGTLTVSRSFNGDCQEVSVGF